MLFNCCFITKPIKNTEINIRQNNLVRHDQLDPELEGTYDLVGAGVNVIVVKDRKSYEYDRVLEFCDVKPSQKHSQASDLLQISCDNSIREKSIQSYSGSITTQLYENIKACKSRCSRNSRDSRESGEMKPNNVIYDVDINENYATVKLNRDIEGEIGKGSYAMGSIGPTLAAAAKKALLL